MEFEYKGKEYMLGEIKEPNKNVTYDMIAIFRIVYYDEVMKCEISKELYDDCEEGAISTYKFINFFYGADADEEELIKLAKIYIDMYSDKRTKK